MNHILRRSVPLVGAAALVSSALLAGTGAALAGKADPVVDVGVGHCTGVVDFRYYTMADLSANKGRWIFIEAKLEVDGEVVATDPPHRVQTGLEQVALRHGVGGAANITVTLTDRKGVSLEISDSTGSFDDCLSA